jgi:hypothetical protein
VITGRRNQFIGAHIPEEEKTIIRRLAEKEGISRWLYRLIRKELIARGFDLKPEAK